MPNVGAPELIIILIVFMVLFGANKLPDLARSIGQSARILKSEVRELSDDSQEQEEVKNV